MRVELLTNLGKDWPAVDEDKREKGTVVEVDDETGEKLVSENKAIKVVDAKTDSKTDSKTDLKAVKGSDLETSDEDSKKASTKKGDSKTK